MITCVSAVLDQETRSKVLSDPDRARAIALLCEAGLSIDEIALALNCNTTLVVSLSLRRARWSEEPAYRPPGARLAKWDLWSHSRNEQGLLLYRPPQTDKAIARHDQRIAGHLSREIRRWLSSIELTNSDRQAVIEQAGLRLDQTPVNKRDEYVFNVGRVVAELLEIWRPNASASIDRDFNALLGRWLASWIRFWISKAAVWDRALDLEFDRLGTVPQAA